jgi:hypothetical protein
VPNACLLPAETDADGDADGAATQWNTITVLEELGGSPRGVKFVQVLMMDLDA